MKNKKKESAINPFITFFIHKYCRLSCSIQLQKNVSNPGYSILGRKPFSKKHLNKKKKKKYNMYKHH